MAMAKRLFLAGICVLSGACGSALPSDQLPSSENSGGATGSGGATAISPPTSLGGRSERAVRAGSPFVWIPISIPRFS